LTLTRAWWAAVSTAVLFALAGCGGDAAPPPAATGDESQPATEDEAEGPTLEVTSPRGGAVLEGNVVSLQLDGSGVEIVSADGDTSGTTGHYHVFVDRDPVAAGEAIPKEAGIVHSTDNPVVLTGLAVGQHRLVVVYGDGTHTRIGEAQAEVAVEVAGPSVDASAPETAPAGSPVTVDVVVEGLTLVAADGDTSGTTGHLHVFVDREPTPAGEPIPAEDGIIHSAETSIPVPNLAPGEHTLWVVAGDGTHTPLDPAVMDKVTVSVVE
jgi:hypothetical protein